MLDAVVCLAAEVGARLPLASLRAPPGHAELTGKIVPR
jgi:hypothetical protein